MVSQRGGSRWMMSSGTPAGAWPPKSRPASTGLMRRTIHTAMTSMHNTVTAMSTPRFSLLDATSSRTNASTNRHHPKQRMVGKGRRKIEPQRRQPRPRHAASRTRSARHHSKNAADIEQVEREPGDKERAGAKKGAAKELCRAPMSLGAVHAALIVRHERQGECCKPLPWHWYY